MTASVLPAALLKVAEDNPEVVALVHAEQQISYRDLSAQIETLRQYLETKIRPGDRVALIMENGIPYVVAAYAIWRAGGVLVALNTALQAKELVSLLVHCEAHVLFLEKDNQSLISELEQQDLPPFLIHIFSNPVRIPAELWEEIFNRVDSLQRVTASSGESRADLETAEAMIIYTSGTTGKPKGVVLSHRNLAENIAAIRQYLELRADDIVMCVLPFFYSFGNSVLHSHLLSGSTIILENSFMYPHKVLETMAMERVSVFYGVPSTYYLLLARTDLSKYDLTGLRLCAQAGGHMDAKRIALFKNMVPSSQFIVMYGQTEATARISYLPPDRYESKTGSVGIAIPGVSISVRKEGDRECSSMEAGEVCVDGPNVMRAYLKENEQTSEVLRGGVLHTGDLGYKDEDGYLFLIGRNSEMIKTGAHRISPLEIEELIARIEGVLEVAVISVEDEVLGAVVGCYIVKEADCSELDLRRQVQSSCKQSLPAYKIPKKIWFTSALPRTASGKVKKHLLSGKE